MERMKLETIISEWERDSKVDVTEPGQALLKNPNLHSKYASQLVQHSLALKAQKHAYNVARRLRSDYYNGRLSEAQLKEHGLQPFTLRLLREDITKYLEADPALQALEAKMSIHEEAITLLGSIIKAISNRSFDIRGYIDWLKYTHGGGGV
jgi:recombination/repair/ssDNA binding protein UvsY